MALQRHDVVAVLPLMEERRRARYRDSIKALHATIVGCAQCCRLSARKWALAQTYTHRPCRQFIAGVGDSCPGLSAHYPPMSSLFALADHSFRIITFPVPQWQALLAPALHRRHRECGRAAGHLHELVSIQRQVHHRLSRSHCTPHHRSPGALQTADSTPYTRPADATASGPQRRCRARARASRSGSIADADARVAPPTVE